MYTLNTKLSEFVENGLKKNNGCPEPIAWCENLISKNKDITLGDGIKMGVTELWADWTLKTFDNQFNSDVKKEFFKCIKTPMIAFHIYTDLKNLEDKEDIILIEKFRGLLPTAEKELKDGIIKRNKK